MKQYPVISLLDDAYLNPTPAVYNNGTHPRSVDKITSISIHHDAMLRPHDYSDHDRLYGEAAYHYKTLGPGLQYHYSISNMGDIYQTRPLDEWLYVVGSAENVTTIAIKLDGYFHPPYNQTPTREQYEALGQLLTDLCEKHPEFPATWPDVRPHRDFSSTACCGDTFAPFITAINKKSDAYNIPANATYDWPSEQPGAPAPVVDTPPPGSPAPPAKPDPTPVPQPTPPVVDPQVADHEKRLGALEKTVSLILAYLLKWKRFRDFYNK